MAGELTDDELEWRRHGLGASDIPALFGMGFSTAVEVWASKLWGHRTPVTPIMQRGHDLEPIVAGKWVEATGRQVVPGGMVWSTRHRRLFATLDYLTDSGEPVECKTVDYWAARDWDAGPPPRVLIQAHTQRLVLGAARAHVAALIVDTWELRHWTVEADPDVDAAIIRWAQAFWDDYIAASTPPPVRDGDRDGRALAEIPLEADTEAEVDPDVVQGWLEAKAEQRDSKKRAADGRAEIMAALNGATFGTINGQRVVSLSEYLQAGRPVRKLMEIT